MSKFTKAQMDECDIVLTLPKAWVTYIDVDGRIKADSEPRNNDGRRHCWWCWLWTEKRQGFTAEYDICLKCNK